MRRILNSALVVILLGVSAGYFLAYGEGSYPFYGDSMGYYMYLPTTFIYHNHKALDWLPADKHLDKSVRAYVASLKNESQRTPKGYFIDKYTYGVAAMEAPFFFTAHAYEKIRGKEANGYSASYRAMLKASSLIYVLLGLIFLYKILRTLFDSSSSVAGVFVVFLGTNLFWFALYQAGMAQAPLFFLYTVLIYTTILVHKSPGFVLFIVAGLTAGLITIIRPTDIICLLIPLLYNAWNKETITQKIAFLKKHAIGVMSFALAFILPLIPQMLYWKKFAGSFLYYSYGQEAFNWLHPKVFDGLFSFANGWLIYSPVMVFAIIGFLCYKMFRPFSLALFIVAPAYIYIIYSWYCYNYINGLGSRPMIDIYPLLAIPLTAFIQYAAKQKFYQKAIILLLVMFLMSINISYSLQQARGILFSEESNMVYNMHMLYKMRANYNGLVTYDIQQVQPGSNTIEKTATLACENYEDSISDHYVPDPTHMSKYVYHVFDDEEYHPKAITIKYNKEQFKNAEWIKCSGMFLCTKPYRYFKHIFTLDIMKGGKSISWSGCKIDNKIGLTEPNASLNEFSLSHSALNKWGYVYFFVRIPQGLGDGDKIKADIWNIGKQEMYLDNICIELYKNKN